MSHLEHDQPERPTAELQPVNAPAERAFLFPAHLHTRESRELIERAQGGDAEALNQLFQAYHSTMVRLARARLGPKLGIKEDADDLAQTTFREATRDLGQYQYRGEGSFLSWLAQILSNKIRDKVEYYGAVKRDSARERSVQDMRPPGNADAPAYDPSSDDLSVTRQVQRREELAILRTALEELSPDHRQAIVLVFFKGMTLRQAGERMARSEDAVRMLLRRAEDRLRELASIKLLR